MPTGSGRISLLHWDRPGDTVPGDHLGEKGVAIEIRYSSRRAEVWNWYWRFWLRGFWRVHLAVAVGICAWAFALAGSASPEVSILRGLVTSALVVAALVLYPQLMFKRQERTLIADEDGIRTTIGRRSGSASWSEISSISEEQGYIVMSTRRKNALIVPLRAFGSDEARADFLNFVKRAKAAVSGGVAQQ